MDAPIEEGFYIDPDSNKTFYVKKVNDRIIFPHWVKAKVSDWKKIKNKNDSNIKQQ